MSLNSQFYESENSEESEINRISIF